MNEQKRKRLGEIIKEKGIVVSKKPIKLSGGGESNYYYNLKPVILDPEALDLLGDLGLEIIHQFNARCVGGIESGSIPIATAIAMKSKNTNNPIPAFYVRKVAKAHGLEKDIEGNLVGSPIVIVDDVVTQGKSVLQVANRAAQKGEVAAIVTLIDREAGADKLFAAEGISFIPIFKHSYFKDHIESTIRKELETEAYQTA
jgi:orotate phosphoribosyltransferase